MDQERKFRVRFTIRQLLAVAFVVAAYFACRNLAVAHNDRRILWFIAPLLSGLLCSSLSAFAKRPYSVVALSAVAGPLTALLVWAVEIRIKTELGALEFFVGSNIDFAFFTLAIAIPISLLSLVVGLSIRFGLDEDVSRWVRTIALTIVVSLSTGIGYAVYRRFHDPVFRYRVLGDSYSFYSALAEAIDNGDSIERVISQLGEGQHRKARTWIEIQMAQMNDSAYKEKYPDGIRIDDIFIAYHRGVGPDWCLQFRNGKLINLDKKWLINHYGS